MNIWIPETNIKSCPYCFTYQKIPPDSPNLVKCLNCGVITPQVVPPLIDFGVSFSGRYSTTRAQYIYLYEPAKNSWIKIDYRTIGASILAFSVPIPNLAPYVSPDGQVRVRVYAYSTAEWTSYFDLLSVVSCSQSYFCESVETVGNRGIIISGDHNSLHFKDLTQLVVKSQQPLTTYKYVDIVAKFKI